MDKYLGLIFCHLEPDLKSSEVSTEISINFSGSWACHLSWEDNEQENKLYALNIFKVW